MAACSIFEEDEVCIPTSTGGFKYGLVVESSEYISSDEDDDEFENRVQKGTVKIAWHPSGDETVVAENKVNPRKNPFYFYFNTVVNLGTTTKLC